MSVRCPTLFYTWPYVVFAYDPPCASLASGNLEPSDSGRYPVIDPGTLPALLLRVRLRGHEAARI